MSSVEIRKVTNRKELDAFIQFHYDLYKGNKYDAPNLYSDELHTLSKERNAAFEFCEAEYFLAYLDGKVVGRIAGIINRRANEAWKRKSVRFGWIDFIDNIDVSRALFDAVAQWGREQGMTEMVGPLGFTDMDREGMLVEGFEERSMFITYYNFPYYIDHMERLGYQKDVDWVELLIEVPYDERMVTRLDKLSERVLRYSKLHIAPMRSRRDYRPIIEKVFRLVNEAYASLYGTVPLDERQIKRYAKKFVPLINPDLACFVLDEHNSLVGFGVSAPSMAMAMKKSNGRLLPFGFLRVLRALKVNDTLDLFLVAVIPEYQNKAVNAIMLNHVLKGCLRMGIRRAETGPQLETNHKVQSQWNFFKTEQHKRRRCYVKALR